MIDLIISLLLAFGISFYAIAVIINVCVEKQIFDLPNERKIHKVPVPSLGGLGIFAGFMVSTLISIPFRDNAISLQYIVAACLIVFFLGVKDDILVISPLKKFLGQLLAAGILVFKGGIVLTNMYGFIGIHEMTPSIYNALTVFAIIGITNAFNLIDGVDGLAGSLGVLVMGCLGLFFMLNNDIEYACIALAMVGSLLAFLIFNFSPAKIFMGDSGSLVLGLVVAVLTIHFVQTAATAPVLSFKAVPAVAFGVLFIPLFDTLRVFSIRILKGKSPFTPDRNHIHHILLDKGLSHKMVTLTLVFANLIIIIIGALGSFLDIHFLLGCLFTIGLSTVGLLAMAKNRPRLEAVGSTTNAQGKEIKKVHLMAVGGKVANQK